MFQIYEVYKCKVLVDLSSFSLVIDCASNLNLRLQNDETRGMMRHMYSSNNNRSNNRHCMHLFLCQLILNVYLNWDLSIVCCKLFFSHFLNYVLCIQSNVKDNVKEVLTVDDFIRE